MSIYPDGTLNLNSTMFDIDVDFPFLLFSSCSFLEFYCLLLIFNLFRKGFCKCNFYRWGENFCHLMGECLHLVKCILDRFSFLLINDNYLFYAVFLYLIFAVLNMLKVNMYEFHFETLSLEEFDI